ncbi:ABC transporter permease [Streptomyces sp. GQFP]|uniref:ABC transporter permease n=1 Tax=Streptomyces sp. GQFP TaxID=2907545 RepID=UPI001F442245|nr:ABC transporter permease [Streptomyces sp. GQFP]UIX32904.1 ABC transporter permease [Streptomyces sp. GQFP]
MTVTVTGPAARRTRRPHGLPWAMLRLHRSALWFWLLLVALAAGILLWMYWWGADAVAAEYARSGCDEEGTAEACFYSGPAYSRFSVGQSLSGALIGLVPLFTALWAGAALIGRELENGTAQLAWTQSVSPARWLAAKLAVPAALLTAGTILLTLLHRLVWNAHTGLHALGSWEWHENRVYVANGTLATAYALLGLAVGALTGLLVRRSLAALGSTFLAFLTLQYVITSQRPRLWPARTVTSTEDYPDDIGMLVEQGRMTSTGQRVDVIDCYAQCVNHYRDYHPSSHFWPLQLMETGIVLALVAAATAAAFWLLRRRTA